jgi:hypothetical protein
MHLSSYPPPQKKIEAANGYRRPQPQNAKRTLYRQFPAAGYAIIHGDGHAVRETPHARKEKSQLSMHGRRSHQPQSMHGQSNTQREMANSASRALPLFLNPPASPTRMQRASPLVTDRRRPMPSRRRTVPPLFGPLIQEQPVLRGNKR